jgi:hypothetical protein
MPFMCSICGEESTRICARCTKDACNNHLCEKCLRCSDCCECEIALSENHHPVVRAARHEPAALPPDPDPEPAPSYPPPDPDPVPDDDPELPAVP